MVKNKNLTPISILIIISIIFFWKVFFQSMIPIPADMLVGSYYPWLDSGNLPIKNPLLTDIFSQFYIWKSLQADFIKNGQFPFWNPYSYSGYPFMATFHSAVFNPFNILLVIFDNYFGWSLLIILQHLLSSISFYLFIKKLTKDNLASVAGAIVYGYNAFMLSWSQFATIGFSAIWLPLILLNTLNFFQSNQNKYLVFNIFLLLLVNISGHFQSMIIIYITYFFFYLYNLFKTKKEIKFLFFFVVTLFLSAGISSFQLLPTIELTHLSIRLNDQSLKDVNYGLIPLKNIITFFAPDYFGNPTTRNFFGSINYHETICFMGIFTLLSFFKSLYKPTKSKIFFLIFSIIFFLLSFDTFLGNLIYRLKIPYLSTSGAGRFIFGLSFFSSVLVSFNLAEIKDFKFFYYFTFIGPFLFFVLLSLINYPAFSTSIEQSAIIKRNLIFPTFISGLLFFSLFFKNEKIKKAFIILIIIIDLFRTGWKNTPFSPKNYVFPENQIINFLKKDNSLFRIEKENGPLLPPNTWAFYQLSSPSGYDPLAPNRYAITYQQNLNGQTNANSSSRYSELSIYDPNKLADYNVKYLLVLKRNLKGDVSPEGEISSSFTKNSLWKKAYEYKSVVVLENTVNHSRTSLLDSNFQEKSIPTITSYTPNEIKITYTNALLGDKLLLRDSFYPGWQAFINGKNTPITDYQSFRLIELFQPSGEITFKFLPSHFYTYLLISFVCLVISLAILCLPNRIPESSRKHFQVSHR